MDEDGRNKLHSYPPGLVLLQNFTLTRPPVGVTNSRIKSGIRQKIRYSVGLTVGWIR